MKASLLINLEKPSKANFLWSNSIIRLSFDECFHTDFYDWIKKNRARIMAICKKWDWSWDIGHADKVIQFSKL